VVKLADALDSKSSGSDIVSVRVRPSAPNEKYQTFQAFGIFCYVAKITLYFKESSGTKIRLFIRWIRGIDGDIP
jgi:hypothetical protein